MAPQPAAAPQPQVDVRRDPFAAQPAPAAAAGYAPAYPFVDAGPQLEIPAEKKGPGKWVGIFIGVALIPLVVGWACGRVYNARLVFNKTIDDAKTIQSDLKPLIEVNKKIANALAQAGMRARGKKMNLDETLVGELEELLRLTDDKETETKQDRIFRTNYARMEDIVIQKLFAYYNNTIKLHAATRNFVAETKRAKDAILKFQADKTIERKYGIVFASDEVGYYIGQLVEVGLPQCKDKKSTCRGAEVSGFQVRVGESRAWSIRPGKHKQINQIVVPIMPNEDWRQVVAGRPGYLRYRQYLMGFAEMSRLSGELARDLKSLQDNLQKQTSRQKLFAPI
ncbi:MAG: hypothetical protein H6707_16200 [Deltaproteobacteria bacterium]|nr:hypothetical protein [Deltaproteobacteria bacterium]